ncbi:PREDICTED: 11-beta-hydroxysteroid dehydrogenase 1B-like [Nelumbo nucifera]|nr:PREDICTED: 11-beta-hydroxysteroid dehydrogenase 1B-like [Nelumbo nucifera]
MDQQQQIRKFMNIVAPPVILLTLVLLSPPFLVLEFFLSILRSFFSENVAGKVVLITGASSGIGKQLAYQYAKKGACLVLVARRQNLLEEVAEKARLLGSPDVMSVQADVSKVDDCQRFIDETVNHFGRLDHLVTNAGIGSVCMFEDSTEINKFTPVMGINFWGSIYATHFAAPHLRNSKGKMIVIASLAGWLPVPRMSFYCASKAALIKFHETYRIEYGADIRSVIVVPGLIESEMTKGRFLSNEGVLMEVDEESREVEVGVFPYASTEGCAKHIVDGACRGEPYVIEPRWYKAAIFCRSLCPEVLEWFYRLVYGTLLGALLRGGLSKYWMSRMTTKSPTHPQPNLLTKSLVD